MAMPLLAQAFALALPTGSIVVLARDADGSGCESRHWSDHVDQYVVLEAPE